MISFILHRVHLTVTVLPSSNLMAVAIGRSTRVTPYLRLLCDALTITLLDLFRVSLSGGISALMRLLATSSASLQSGTSRTRIGDPVSILTDRHTTFFIFSANRVAFSSPSTSSSIFLALVHLVVCTLTPSSSRLMRVATFLMIVARDTCPSCGRSIFTTAILKILRRRRAIFSFL